MTDLLGDTVPFPMSLAIANYSMATFVGHFQYKIELEKDNLIPANVIIFVLAKSGAKKTSSMLKLEKSLKEGYNVIDNYRFQKAKEWADENETNMPRINPLSNALATEAGMVKRLNDFKAEGIGLPSLYVDEISTELASNADMIPNIKLVAQLFDVGDMKSKPLKDPNNQSEEVVGMGMSALFIGSEHGILEDEPVLRKFETEFISKLARRSFFVYPIFDDEEEEVTTIDDLLNSVSKKKENGYAVNKKINQVAQRIAETSLLNDSNTMMLSKDCAELYTLYSIYCEEMVNEEVEAVALEQQHRHWKALKLAMVYAVFNGHSFVEVQDLKEAIHVAELTGKDIGTFIEKANRLPYEVLLEHYQQGGEPLSVHDMVKKKWINKPSAVKDMLILANSKSGTKGMFEQTEDDAIVYKSFEQTEGLGLSYLRCSGSKEDRQAKVAVGYTYTKSSFPNIGTIMKTDSAYCPFEFKGGIRGKDYIIGGADFIVLDVDDSDFTDTECSDMLADYNHIIARTSSNNPYKFRVLLPLDVTIDIENDKWKPFIKKVSEYLGINSDLLPKSQIYYGYADRELIINEDGMNLEASELVKNIEAVSPKVKQLKPHMVGDAWDERMDEFSNAYNAQAGDGLHNNLWYATAKAHDLGFTLEMGLALLDDIVDYIEDEPRKGYIDTLKRRMITDKNTYARWVEEANALG